MRPSGRSATTSVKVPPRSIQNSHLPAVSPGVIRAVRPRTRGACPRVARSPTWSYRPTRCDDGTGPYRRGVPTPGCARALSAALPGAGPRAPASGPRADIPRGSRSPAPAVPPRAAGCLPPGLRRSILHRSTPAAPPTAYRSSSHARYRAACPGPGPPGGNAHSRRENQPAWIDASVSRLFSQVPPRQGVVLQDPQYASRHVLEKAHPDIEHRRQDLVAVVEAAKDEAFFGQTDLGPGRRAFGELSPGIVCLIGLGQMDNLLRVERLVLLRENELVPKDIVIHARSQGPGITEITDPNRGRPMRKDARPGMSRVPHQIYHDVHFQVPHQLRRLEISFGTYIEEPIETPCESGPHLAPVIDAEGSAYDLELRAVVELEELRNAVSDGVFPKIPGQVSDTDLGMLVSAFLPRRLPSPHPVFEKMLRAQHLFPGILRDGDQCERLGQ